MSVRGYTRVKAQIKEIEKAKETSECIRDDKEMKNLEEIFSIPYHPLVFSFNLNKKQYFIDLLRLNFLVVMN